MRKIIALLFLISGVASASYLPGAVPDSSTFTLGTTPEMPVGGMYEIFAVPLQSTATAAFRMGRLRNQYVTLIDDAGVILGTSTTNAIKVDESGVTQPVSQSGIWNLTTSSLTVSFGGTAQPVTSTSTTLMQGGVILTQANGALQNYTTNITTSAQGGVWNIANSSFSMAGLEAVGTTATTNPIKEGIVVSSANMPTPQTDGKVQYTMADQFGRLSINGFVPNTLVLHATATITATTQTIFISSAGVNTFINIIGCLGTNSSASNTYITFYPVGNAGSNSNSKVLGMPANDVPVGAFPPSGVFFRSTVNSDVMIQANAGVSSLFISCDYYTSQ